MKKVIAISLRVSIILMILAYFFIKLDVRKVISSFDINIIKGILAVQPLALLTLLFYSLRFLVLIRADRSKFKNIFESVILGYGLIIFTPGRGSELIRPIYLREYCGISLHLSLAAISVEKILDLICIMFLLVSQVYFYKDFSPYFSIVPLIVVIILFIISLKFKPFVLNIIQLIPGSFIRTTIHKLYEQYLMILTQRNKIETFLCTSLIWLSGILSFYFYLNIALPIHISFLYCLYIFSLVMIGAAVPITPGAFGIFEAITVYALGKIGIPPEQGLIVAIGLHISQRATSLSCALFLLSIKKIGIGSIMLRAKECLPANK